MELPDGRVELPRKSRDELRLALGAIGGRWEPVHLTLKMLNDERPIRPDALHRDLLHLQAKVCSAHAVALSCVIRERERG